MVVLNQLELESLAQWVNDELSGAQLQQIFSFNEGLVFVFYKFKTYSLVLDLQMTRPWIYLTEANLSFMKKKTPWPVQVFLTSHAENLRLNEVLVQHEYGRVLKFSLGNAHKVVTLQFIMIPKMVNLIVESEKKKISFHKPKELSINTAAYDPQEVRSISMLQKQWEQMHLKSSGPKEALQNDLSRVKAQIEKNLTKKNKAREALMLQIAEIQDNAVLVELGNKLKTHGLQQGFSDEEKIYLNLKLSKASNIEMVFERIRANTKKLEGSMQRLELLNAEIEKLTQDLESPEQAMMKRSAQSGTEKQGKERSTFKNVKTRKLEIDEETTFYVGKSATDNLALLRQSRGWDLWFHFKDYPGAYGIIRWNKNRTINPSLMQKCSEFLIRESLKKEDPGNKIAIVFTECRFVRPIKGDKIGRVTYTHAQEIYFSLQ